MAQNGRYELAFVSKLDRLNRVYGTTLSLRAQAGQFHW
jgi:hypothetical protein